MGEREREREEEKNREQNCKSGTKRAQNSSALINHSKRRKRERGEGGRQEGSVGERRRRTREKSQKRVSPLSVCFVLLFFRFSLFSLSLPFDSGLGLQLRYRRCCSRFGWVGDENEKKTKKTKKPKRFLSLSFLYFGGWHWLKYPPETATHSPPPQHSWPGHSPPPSQSSSDLTPPLPTGQPLEPPHWFQSATTTTLPETLSPPLLQVSSRLHCQYHSLSLLHTEPVSQPPPVPEGELGDQGASEHFGFPLLPQPSPALPPHCLWILIREEAGEDSG